MPSCKSKRNNRFWIESFLIKHISSLHPPTSFEDKIFVIFYRTAVRRYFENLNWTHSLSAFLMHSLSWLHNYRKMSSVLFLLTISLKLVLSSMSVVADIKLSFSCFFSVASLFQTIWFSGINYKFGITLLKFLASNSSPKYCLNIPSDYMIVKFSLESPWCI